MLKQKKKNSGLNEFSNCIICQEKFEKNRWNQITCVSKTCQFTRQRQKSKKWRLKNVVKGVGLGSKPSVDNKDLGRFKKIVYADNSYYVRKEPSKLPKECSICGKDWERGWNAKLQTHTEECLKQRAKERQLKNWAIRIGYKYTDCLICKKSFRKIAQGKYCSKECFVLLY